ncbi:MAG: diguanylate cyclase, partial [Pseudomonadota bacterium]
MNELVIHSLYLLAGIAFYASAYHLAAARSQPYNRMQMLFVCLPLSLIPLALFLAATFQATSIIEFVGLLKWNLAFTLCNLLLFTWFIALYTRIQPRSFLISISALYVVLFAVNLIEPYSLQYDHVDGLRALHLPWGEVVMRMAGHNGFWFYIGSLATVATMSYSIYAFGILYYRNRRSVDLWMLFAVGLFFMGVIDGILVRMSVIDFIELGSFSLIAMVLVMGATLTYETQQRLRNSENKFRLLFENSSVAMFVIDPNNGRITQANDIALKMTGFDAEEIQNTTVADHSHPDDLEESRKRYEQFSNGQVDHLYFEKRYIRKDGSIFYGYSSISTMKDDKSNIINFIGSTIDITEHKRTEESLRISEQRLRDAQRIGKLGSLDWNLNTNELLLSDEAIEIYGLDKNRKTHNLEEVINLLHPEDKERVEIGLQNSIAGIARYDMEHRMVRPDGEVIHIHASAELFRDQSGKPARLLGIIIDISERKASEEKIQHLAFHDHLTGLPNRLLLLDRLQQALISSARIGGTGALLFIDLDNFKNLNDTLGHDIGDLLLQQVAQRLKSCIRIGDSEARLGGDEFVVMLLDLSEQPIEAAAQTEAIGEKILAALSQPYQLEKNIFRCTASIGVTLFNGNQQVPEELMKQADIAMYQAKKAGRNTLRFFDLQMQESISARVSLESELHNALEFKQFHLHYQIQVDSSLRAVGAEALLRWVHPERGMVMPSHFIPLAEETGLILLVGQWVLETACAQLKTWQPNA